MNKNRLIVFILLALAQVGFAQDGTIKVKKKENKKDLPKLDTLKRKPWLTYESRKTPGSGVMSTEWHYGFEYIPLTGLNKGLFTDEPGFSLHHEVFGGGLNLLFFRQGYRDRIGSFFSVTRLCREKRWSNGSSWELSGLQFHLLTLGGDVLRSRSFDLIPAIAFEYGGLRLVREELIPQKQVYRNLFFCLHFTADARYNIVFKRSFMSLGLRCGVLYDVGNPRWVPVSGGGELLPGTAMKGYYYQLLLCLPLLQ